MNFYTELFSIIENNIYNDFTDNWDYFSFGELQRERNAFDKIDSRYVLMRIREISHLLEGYRQTFDLLANEESKHLLIQLVAFQVLGWARYKLPLSSKAYFERIEHLEKVAVDRKDWIEVSWIDGGVRELYKTKVTLPSGVSTEFYYCAGGVHVLFECGQYRYRSDSIKISPKQGNVVIDAGGCWGDSSILFADLVGSEGKVYTFECMPKNIEVLNLNLGLVGSLAEPVSLIDRALWSKPEEQIEFAAAGPASCIKGEWVPGDVLKVATDSIDWFIEREKLPMVDFIKMDIEGSELEALKGAEECLRRFKPKLAISVYHNACRDMIDVPIWLDGLKLGYEFYLGHYTIHQYETVLYAIAK